ERRSRSDRERSRAEGCRTPGEQLMIDLRFVARALWRMDEAVSEAVVCGIWRDERPLTGLACLLDWRLAGRLSRLARQGFLVGDPGEGVVVSSRARLPLAKRVPW